MRKESQIFYDLSRGAVHKGQSNRIHQRMEMAILHRRNISFPQIAWFCGCHLRTVKRWIIRIELGEPISDLPRSGHPPVFTKIFLPQNHCILLPDLSSTRVQYMVATMGCEVFQTASGADWLHHESFNYWAYSENACLTSSSEEIFPANH